MAIQSSLAWWIFFPLSFPTIGFLGWTYHYAAWSISTRIHFEFCLNVRRTVEEALFNIILRAVMSGFLQAQGIAVPLGQMEKLFGIKMNGYFIESVYTLFKEVIRPIYDFSA